MIIISNFLVVVLLIIAIIHFCRVVPFVKTYNINYFNSIFSYCFICVRNPKVKNPGTIIGNFFVLFFIFSKRRGVDLW